MTTPQNEISVADKYRFYESSVQCHDSDIDFINKEYERIYKTLPLKLREDFGGTGLLACEWVRQSKDHFSWAIDLDVEPISYGMKNHYSKLDEVEKKRMRYLEANVLDNFNFKADVVVAFNFSYYIFKKRNELLQYFKKVREGLGNKGAFFIDLFGGTATGEPLVEETEHDNFSYLWDCDKFNPITSECLYYIHFLDLDENKKYEKVFTYDWRMWGPSELREILEDAGFRETIIYWEGDNGEGEGDGNFYPTLVADNCESWITYIIALP